MAERLVVIGGDAGGMSAASQARRMRGPEDLLITAFERSRHTSTSACGIPFYVGDVVHDPERLVVRTPERFREAHSIDARTRHEVLAIDHGAHTVTVRDLDANAERQEGYDLLMIATGSVPSRPPIPGIDARNVFGVQTLDEGIALRRTVDDEHPARAVVIGGGYIGLEIAEALVGRDIAVTVVEMGPQPMSTLDEDMGALVAQAMRDFGITVDTGEQVRAIETVDDCVGAVVTDARTIPADIVVLGLGVSPNSALARAAGFPIGETGGVVTDETMRVGDGVWAAGDCVQSVHRVSGEPVVVALGTHANKQGRVAGTNIGGGRATFPGVLGTAVTKVCSFEIARTGLTEAQARSAGIEARAVTVDSWTRAGYFPGKEPIKVKIVFGPDGDLLGGQIVGREGAAKRIDVIATALWNRMNVAEMQMLDLSYAPPFAPVWDPVIYAARVAAEGMR